MRILKIAVPEDVEDKVRRRAGELYGARKGALSAAVTSALQRWLVPEPEVYIGATEHGMSFEIPREAAQALLLIIAAHVRPSRIRLAVRERTRDRRWTTTLQHLPRLLGQLEHLLTDSTTLVEYDGASLVSGGGGCYSLALRKDGGVQQAIARDLLRHFNLQADVDGDRFDILVRGGRVEVL